MKKQEGAQRLNNLARATKHSDLAGSLLPSPHTPIAWIHDFGASPTCRLMEETWSFCDFQA